MQKGSVWKSYNVEILFSPLVSLLFWFSYPNRRLNISPCVRLMVQCCGGGGGRRRNGSRAYFSYVYNFFHNSFFSRLPFFEYATSNQLFYREKCIFYAYTDKTDCRYKLTHRFRFHIYAKKKPAFLANKVRVFCGAFPRTDDFYTNFFRCFSSSWISICAVCIIFSILRGNKKSTSLQSGEFLS